MEPQPHKALPLFTPHPACPTQMLRGKKVTVSQLSQRGGIDTQTSLLMQTPLKSCIFLVLDESNLSRAPGITQTRTRAWAGGTPTRPPGTGGTQHEVGPEESRHLLRQDRVALKPQDAERTHHSCDSANALPMPKQGRRQNSAPSHNTPKGCRTVWEG